MYKIIQTVLVSLFSLHLSGCGINLLKTDGEQKKDNARLEFAGDLLNFSEIAEGQRETNVRMIITDGFLRIDDGPKSEDYVLFDRAAKIIYNVVAEEKNIMVIDSQDETHNIELSPAYPILWNVESQTSHALMRSDDKNAASATHYRLKLNQKECYNLVAVDHGMEKPLAAIREFRSALANQLKKHYRAQEGQECYEAINIFTPLNHLHQGFPIREWSVYGYQRFLIEHRRMIIFPERLFKLPENYTRTKL